MRTSEFVYLASEHESVWHRVPSDEVCGAALALCGHRLKGGHVHLRRESNPPDDDDPRKRCQACKTAEADTERKSVLADALVIAATPVGGFGWPRYDNDVRLTQAA